MDIQSIYDAIGNATPMTTDCGAICGAACCHTDDDGQGGVALLACEHKILQNAAWGSIAQDDRMGAPMLMCGGMCDRNLRPFLCRIFPLCPVIGKNNKWTVRMDARARAVCPLTRGGLKGLNPEFVQGAANAVRMLAADPEGEAFLTRWSEIENEFRKPLW